MLSPASIRRATSAVFIVLFCSADARALDPARALSQYALQEWSSAAGLPHESIQALAQTPDGYLWLGTMGGLVRFDGVRFTAYTPENSGLPHDNVWSLCVDQQGRLWIGTDGGGVALWNDDRVIAVHNAKTGLSSDKIRPILAARDGSIWVATNGGGVNRFKDGRWSSVTTKQGLANDFVWALAEDADGGIWMGTNGQGLNRWKDGTIDTLHTPASGLPHDTVTALYCARNGDLWAGTWDGLGRLRQGRWKSWKSGDGLPANLVRSVREDAVGNVWIGTAEGLARFQNETFSTLTRGEDAGAYVRALLEDGEGNVWVGLFGAGLARLSDKSFQPLGRPEGAPFSATYTVMEARDGAMWVGTYRGVSRVKDGHFTSLTARDGLPTEAIGPIAEDLDGSLWIGTTTHGIAHWKSGKLRCYTDRDGLPGNNIRSLWVDHEGTLWVATTAGLGSRRGDRWQVTREGMLAHVRVLLEGRDGSLWAGTPTGLGHLRHGRWSPVPLARAPHPPAVFSIYEDRQGVVWAGTAEALCRVVDGEGRCFRIKGGALDSTIFSILEDDVGALWMSSAKGVVRVEKKALDAYVSGAIATLPYQTFGRADGMRSSQVNGGFTPAAWKARDGRLWFPTMLGLAMVDPSHLQRNLRPPAVKIEEVSVNNAVVPPEVDAHGPGVRHLEFHYTGLSLSAPERVQFMFRLDPFDTDWIEVGTRRAAFYNNIPPGSYTFRVRAANSDGVWSEADAVRSVHIKPHLYERRWFQVLCAAAAIAAAGSAYALRMRRRRAHERELERRVDEAMAHVQVLDGLLPICASCKKIRDDGGYWNQIETYISEHSRAGFSHSVCPDCIASLYPDYVAARGQ